MKTKDCKTMTSQLMYVVAIKLNEIESYPKSLSEWLEVYFYSDSAGLGIGGFVMQEMKTYNESTDDKEIWKKIYHETKDKDLKKLAFEMLPNEKGFNKKFISFKSSLSNLDEGVKTIIPRDSLLHDIRMLREMLKHYETLDELMVILTLTRRIDPRIDIFGSFDLKSEFHNIETSVVNEILKYIALCTYDLSKDFLLKDEDKKLGLLDLNDICKKIHWKDCKKIFEIIKENLNRSFGSYIKLYQKGNLSNEVEYIVLSKIKSSRPTLEELVEAFESLKDCYSDELKNYLLGEIINKFKNN